MSDTLVLDKNWQPTHFCSWQDAVKLYWEGRASIVKEDEGGRVLRSPSFEMGMPRVIRVANAWTKRRKASVPCTRRNILIRDRATCQYCGKVVSTEEYTIDHVLPRCQGGTTHWANVVVCCQKCNRRKGGQTPEQAGMHLLGTPTVPKPTDPQYNFKMRLRKIRPEWQQWLSAETKAYLYWNTELVP